MIPRILAAELLSLAVEYPVVTILGPRQAGKTTLAKMTFPGYGYVNLEDPESRSLATIDPRAFFRLYPPPLVIDEIQRSPELCSWIQVIVDESGRKGEFILTGSSQLGLRSAVAQSLAGRNAMASLYPFSFAELGGAGISLERDQLLVSGFFPRVHADGQEPTRAYRNYIQTYIERDLRNLLNIKNLVAFERFLGLLAGRTGQLVNLNSLASDTGVSSTTLAEWLGVLEASLIVYRLKPFFENYGKRLVKAPKLYFTDVGIVSSLLGIRTTEAAGRDPLLGNLFENMVVMEAVKQSSNRGEDASLYFFRDQNGREIDLIIERDRRLIPVEIKSSGTWNPEFAKNVQWFQALSPRADRGMVVYGGDQRIESDGYRVLPFREAEF
jgi:predicted AAA+ superfamily ATPase